MAVDSLSLLEAWVVFPRPSTHLSEQHHSAGVSDGGASILASFWLLLKCQHQDLEPLHLSGGSHFQKDRYHGAADFGEKLAIETCLSLGQHCHLPQGGYPKFFRIWGNTHWINSMESFHLWNTFCTLVVICLEFSKSLSLYKWRNLMFLLWSKKQLPLWLKSPLSGLALCASLPLRQTPQPLPIHPQASTSWGHASIWSFTASGSIFLPSLLPCALKFRPSLNLHWKQLKNSYSKNPKDTVSYLPQSCMAFPTSHFQVV